jgi:hypothetical protein
VSNPDKDTSIAKPESSQAAPAAEISNNPPILETTVNKDVIENADEAQNEDDQPLEEEHSTTNTQQNKQIVLNDDHTMNTDEFLNSSSGYAHTAKTGESNGDEGNSVLKPTPDLYLPSEVLQGLRNLTPDEALDKLLSSFGAYIPTAADREKALQLEQEEHERRFYREIIEGDMLALLERDSAIYFNIKALFNKLQTPRTREDLFLRVTQAEAFLEQYAKHFQQLLDNSQTQDAKLKLKEKYFEQAKQRNNEAAQMKAESAGAFLQHYKKVLYYPQIVTHDFVVVGNFKNNDDLPITKLCLKLKTCCELIEIVTHNLAIDNFRILYYFYFFSFTYKIISKFSKYFKQNISAKISTI